MFVGVVRTRDIILHPAIIISMQGVTGYLELLYRCFSLKRYLFVNSIEGLRCKLVDEERRDESENRLH